MTEAVKEVLIKASPATIFTLLTDRDEFVKWMGTDARLVAHPGGEFYALCGGVNPAVGTFLEVVPDTRVVFTFGWDLPGHPIPAGSTTVAITLIPEGDATLVRLVHSGLPEDAMDDHLRGWTYYFARLITVVDGGDPGPDQANDDIEN